MKTITILISPQGDAKVEAHGFQGGECRRATARFRTALGQDSDEQLKPEFARQTAEGTLKVSGGQATPR